MEVKSISDYLKPNMPLPQYLPYRSRKPLIITTWIGCPSSAASTSGHPKPTNPTFSTIQNLIIPYIGSMEMQKLKPYHMENLYTTLSKTPCGSYIEGKKQELTEK